MRLIGIGWYFAICIVGGMLGGLGIDYLAGTTPLFTLIGLFAGLFIAFYGGYRMIREALGTQAAYRRKDKRD
jgi:F0F1-type ATP synthase assembly protein I